MVLGAPAVEDGGDAGAAAQAAYGERKGAGLIELPDSAALADALWSWKAAFVYGYFAWALYVHSRGRVRHKFHRQLTDHSTFVAPYNAIMYGFSSVPNAPFVDMARFPELAPLQENWRAIRAEALKLFDEGHIRAAASYNDLGFNSFFRRGWKRFYLKWYDAPLPSAMALCPRTVALVQSIPTINGAMFAMLPAGSDLGRHRDPFAGSLRYHLGLVTPNSDACRIVVDGEAYSWRDGEAVMFDETFIHWAENRGDVDRLILFADVERPLRSRFLNRLNHWVEKTIVRATQTENVPGERVGALNRLFGVAYYVRLPLKWVKARNKYVYYALKFLTLGLIAYAVFFTH
ncbi:MAG: aspartyl/asparaginyl beta-hydroxylase domain-containing protein [Burkholderiales bacterium]|nr:aspartyl/asparaginyl beta-hydroxylase domain-containing protein [Burkholderiales bacterium]